jgi:hypothetical protein
VTFKPGDLKRRRIEVRRSPRPGLNRPTSQRFFCLSSAAAPRLQTLPPTISLGKPTYRFVDEAGPQAQTGAIRAMMMSLGSLAME